VDVSLCSVESLLKDSFHSTQRQALESSKTRIETLLVRFDSFLFAHSQQSEVVAKEADHHLANEHQKMFEKVITRISIRTHSLQHDFNQMDIVDMPGECIFEFSKRIPAHSSAVELDGSQSDSENHEKY
jgi:hypothetical protein